MCSNVCLLSVAMIALLGALASQSVALTHCCFVDYTAILVINRKGRVKPRGLAGLT